MREDFSIEIIQNISNKGMKTNLPFSKPINRMFDEIFRASKGIFEKVHYLHPSRVGQPGPHGIFHGLVKRARLRVTPTRATRAHTMAR